MFIYLLESLILSSIQFAWLSIQQMIYTPSHIDQVIVYTQAIYTLMVLVGYYYFENYEPVRTALQKSFFVCHFTCLVLYGHLMENWFSFAYLDVIPHDTNTVCSLSKSHSAVYRQVFLSTSPIQIALAFSSVTLAFLVVQTLLALSSMQEAVWNKSVLLILPILHITITAFDTADFYTVFLYMTLIIYFLFLVVQFVFEDCIEHTPEAILELFPIIDLVITVLLTIALWTFLWYHTGSGQLWTFYLIYFWIWLQKIQNVVIVWVFHYTNPLPQFQKIPAAAPPPVPKTGMFFRKQN